MRGAPQDARTNELTPSRAPPIFEGCRVEVGSEGTETPRAGPGRGGSARRRRTATTFESVLGTSTTALPPQAPSAAPTQSPSAVHRLPRSNNNTTTTAAPVTRTTAGEVDRQSARMTTDGLRTRPTDGQHACWQARLTDCESDQHDRW
ncbi:hypothetical protein BDZ97DRAFT_1929202 [Flammula alnicola]|nr:hypothetical protein BDZ97DRAFT_1931356 [Flammula alnicola]KAF8953942.1 hypothetical protein BDZ97DRAFT_1929202 [Flammula alnicola]